MTHPRNRTLYALLMLLVIGLGLGSRHYATHLPLFIASYAGDTLWALEVFLTTGFLFPTYPTKKIAVIALAFAFFIEFSQLYHAPWLDDIRHNRLAGLILGYGFLWSDLLCYSVGIAVGAGVELKTRQQ
ncbi:MAG: DUF2809 domain-containing protein [Methylococcales bacterium]|nr:DUF2809 domain-containing protein [Methylococcales bacterium]MDP3840073.1 DUF2809 domain-containing protein [Methylococcales bacterium]